MTVFAPVRMPSLAGATGWLNSEPLTPEGLRGSVALVDFWTLTCINWLRTEPYIRAWSRAYRDDGLVVIGVHTPEFTFEHDLELVRSAVADREIDYPVAADNDYAVWRAFDNHYWPALYFVDRDGMIRDAHFGEGRYEESERLLQELLGIGRDPVRVESEGVEAEADWEHLRTPETYLGFGRGERFASPGGATRHAPAAYRLPDRLGLNEWALEGDWAIGAERAVVQSPGGRIAFRFQSRDVHIVLAPSGDEPTPFRVTLDGAAPGESHGVDVDPEGNGVLREGRLYQLVRTHDGVRERTVEIAFAEPGAGAYVFTFG